LTPDRDIKLDPINVPLRKEHVESSDGGIAVYFKEAVNYESKTDHEINGLECVWVELKIKKTKSYVCYFIWPSEQFGRGMAEIGIFYKTIFGLQCRCCYRSKGL
jgi:hypothetical protein